ncbi:MAG: T9SS type A sorting domain-containing protein [Bacteroidetes bacterium]|nr:T9SS type A sorting domain-containing protein [Bacteroidota bacterium]
MKSITTIILLIILSYSSSAQWIMQHIGYEQPYVAVSPIEAISKDTLWTISANPMGSPSYQYFSRSADGGNTWIPGNISGYNDFSFINISAINYSTAWVVLENITSGETQALKTTDGGSSWQTQFPCAFGTNHPISIHFWNINEGVCIGQKIGGHFEIYTTNDAGFTWTLVDFANIPNPLVFENIPGGRQSVIENTIWLSTSLARVLKSDDKGLHWTVSTPPFLPSAMRLEVEFLNLNHGIVREVDFGYAETFNGGTSWTLFNATGTLPDLGNLGLLTWVPGSYNTLIGNYIGIHYSFDGGHTWSVFDTLQTKRIYGTAWTDISHGWAGDVTEPPNPNQTGIWKFTGTLNAILEMDPRQGGVTFYPNPCKGLVNMVLAGFLGEDVVLDIFNLQGQKVYAAEFHQTLIQSDRKIDLSFLKSGTYVVSVRSGKKSLVKKIVVEK